MATDWIEKQSRTRDKLAAKGVWFVFTRAGIGKPDPITSIVEDRVDSTFTAPGIMLKGAREAANWNRAIYAQVAALIEQGDEVLLLGAGTYDPALADAVEINGETWLVKGIGILRPALTPLLYYVVIHRN